MGWGIAEMPSPIPWSRPIRIERGFGYVSPDTIDIHLENVPAGEYAGSRAVV
jgi:hypothetical protein